MNISGQLVVKPKSEDLEVTVPEKKDDKKEDKPVTVKAAGKPVPEQKAQLDSEIEATFMDSKTAGSVKKFTTSQNDMPRHMTDPGQAAIVMEAKKVIKK